MTGHAPAAPADVASREAPRALEVLAFWWAAGPGAWFSVDEAFDEACRGWMGLAEEAAAGALDAWQETAAGTLALLILLDQIPRNAFRGTPRAFATDARALAVAEAAIARGCDKGWPMPMKNFFYLPLMHAEDLAVQDRAIDLYRAAGDREALLYAYMHHEAIRRFGRFPHRNPILGRETTPAERAFLDAGGFAG